MSSSRPSHRVVHFISYWSLDEPLFDSTVVPILELLREEGMADHVVVFAMAGGGAAGPERWRSASFEVVPLRTVALGWKPLSRAITLLMAVLRMVRRVRKDAPLFIGSRGVLAGGFAWFVSRITGVPFSVDSYEPHAEYMVWSGEWNRNGLLHKALAWSMRRQERDALRIVTVTRRYAEVLVDSGVPRHRLLVAPCPVPDDHFYTDDALRRRARMDLGYAQDDLVGVYLGKFGGLYHDRHAFRAFSQAARSIGDRFRLLVLTPAPRDRVLSGLREAGMPLDRVRVERVPHERVPSYLAAADLAFATYRSSPASLAISPVKIAEYWASGLPVLLTRGVGDDAGILEDNPCGGAVFDPTGNDLEQALDRVLRMVGDPGQRACARALARTHRSDEATRRAYREIVAAARAGGH